jgi:uncharacterized membrane protein
MNVLNKDQKEIISLYALVMVGALMMLVPYSLRPFAGVACMSVGLIATYFYKCKYKSNDLIQFHMRYIIRTVWWSTLILVVGVGLFCSILGANGDWSSVYNVQESIARGVILTESDMKIAIFSFVETNSTLISWVALLSLPPYPLYLAYRAICGVKKLINK